MTTHKKLIIAGCAAPFLIGGAVAAAFSLGYIEITAPASDEKSIEGYAKEMVEKCASAAFRPTCYETEVPKLVTELPTERIFDVIKHIRVLDPEYLYCHVLAHKLGSYEVSKDPNNWLDVIAKGPTDGMCSNGYAHGAMVTRFHSDDLTPEAFQLALKDLAIACEPRTGFNPTDLTKAICYHGIGHVLVHMSLAKVKESLQGCETVGLKKDGNDYRQLCTEGVYMQLFQPLEPEDFALVGMLPYTPTKETLKDFCSSNSENDRQYGACWREAWPLFGDDIYNAEGTMNYCSQITEAQDADLCFVSAFTINGRHNLGSPDKMAAACNGLPARYKGQCFSRGANAFPEEDPKFIPQAVDMCSRANTPEAQDECYGFLANVASFNFHPSSPAFEQLCSTLPKKWESTCRGGS